MCRIFRSFEEGYGRVVGYFGKLGERGISIGLGLYLWEGFIFEVEIIDREGVDGSIVGVAVYEIEKEREFLKKTGKFRFERWREIRIMRFFKCYWVEGVGERGEMD